MLPNNDFMRVNITKDRDFEMWESPRHRDAESSSTAMEFLCITYKKFPWEFSKAISFGSEGDHSFPKGTAFSLKPESHYRQLLGDEVLVTGSSDFKFDKFPVAALNHLERTDQAQKLSDIWNSCVDRSSSYLNFSLTPMIGDRKLPKSPWLPVFLAELNQYYTEDSQVLFKGFTSREQKMFKVYLDDAFERTLFRNQSSGVADYGRAVLFLEDPWLLSTMIEFGERFQQAQNAGESLLEDPAEVYRLIYLARWYWAEKQANIPFY